MSKQQLKDNAEHQRRKLMNSERKGRDAIEQTAKNVKEWSESRGEQRSYDECRRYVEKLAYKADQERK